MDPNFEFHLDTVESKRCICVLEFCAKAKLLFLLPSGYGIISLQSMLLQKFLTLREYFYFKVKKWVQQYPFITDFCDVSQISARCYGDAFVMT